MSNEISMQPRRVLNEAIFSVIKNDFIGGNYSADKIFKNEHIERASEILASYIVYARTEHLANNAFSMLERVKDCLSVDVGLDIAVSEFNRFISDNAEKLGLEKGHQIVMHRALTAANAR